MRSDGCREDDIRRLISRRSRVERDGGEDWMG